MSRENVEIVRRVFEEFEAGLERGDPGAFFDYEAVSADYELVMPPGAAIERSIYRGREGWVEFFRMWTEDFDDWSFRVERLIDAGDGRVVALTRQFGVGRTSGAPVEWAWGQLFEVEDGCVVRARFYLSYEEAFEAAGVSA